MKGLKEKRLQKSSLALIAQKFRLTGGQAATVAGVSERTYNRWEGSHILSAAASRHVLKITEVCRSGLQLYDNNEHTLMIWMSLEIPAIGHKVPVEMMIHSLEGANTINNLLCRIEHGILA